MALGQNRAIISQKLIRIMRTDHIMLGAARSSLMVPFRSKLTLETGERHRAELLQGV